MSARQLGLFTDKYTLTETGLEVTGSPDFEEWMDYGQSLQRFDGTARQFAIGDWIVQGFDTYEHGKWETILGVWGVGAQTTLAQYEWVARRVKSFTRVKDLSFTHHRTVADLPDGEQRRWLEQAAQQKWSVDELSKQIRLSQREPDPEPVEEPSNAPTLIVAKAEDTGLPANSIDLIVTSPPYNLGQEHWPMGGNGRTPRDEGIGYQDAMPEQAYQRWQIECLKEMYRVAKPGASLFYNHKIRNRDGEIIHPLDWLRNYGNPWTLRQEIIWDRGSTHNHSATLFWPEDERIYWFTKGKPELPNRPIGMSTIWTFHGPVVDTWHPAPFCEELPRRCIEAVGRDGIVVLDPFAGSCTTLKVALAFGYHAIGVDVSADYLQRAAEENEWTISISNS